MSDDELKLAKMLATPEGQLVLEEFLRELFRSKDVVGAYNKAISVAQQRGTLPALQIGLTLDLLTFLKLLLPVIIDKWKELSNGDKK